MKIYMVLPVIRLALFAPIALAFEGGFSSTQWIGLDSIYDDSAAMSVSKTSIFGDMYSASRISGLSIFELVSERKIPEFKKEDIKKYLEKSYDLKGDDLENATDAMLRMKSYSKQWIDTVRKVTTDDLSAAEMADSADVLVKRGLYFEIELLEWRSNKKINVTEIIGEFSSDIESIYRGVSP